MYYELKGRLLAIAMQSRKDHKSWRESIKTSLQEMNPAIDGFFVCESMYQGATVGGVCTSGVDLSPHWKDANNNIENAWVPNRRYAAGKRFAKAIAALPQKPDPIETLLNELGFKGRFLELNGCRQARPGFAVLPKISRAFLHWDTEYPPINDPDIEEVLTSAYYLACEENDRIVEQESA